MAIYHLHVKNISRRDGRSAVASSAYRAGETLPNEAEEKDSAFGGRRDVVFTEIRLPADATAWMPDRARLWNAVEAAEKRKDACLAKEIEFALPRELDRAIWIEVAREMADTYVTLGHIVDAAIHEDGKGNDPHAHLMLTTRAVGADRFKLKLRDADGVAVVSEARETWAKIANAALGKAGAEVEIDARSNAGRGIDTTPTKHQGPDPALRRARRWGKK
ncbi:MobA/MobL family protein [Bradyrhizobium sp. 14AA]